MSNKGLLVIIAIILIGIFTVLFIQANETSESEEIVSNIGETIEEIGDEIDDNTDAR